MAITPEQLSLVIAETFSPNTDARKKAEENLGVAQKTPGYASQILNLVASSTIDQNVRQAGGVLFKNFVKRGWVLEDAQEHGIVIDEAERVTIKTHLVELMCTTPPLIQVQLSESISLIAKTDYPEKWNGLLPQLVQKFFSNNQDVVNGVLKTANAIFKSFRYVQRSDDLYRVILYTLQGIQEPLLELLKQTGQAVQSFSNDPVQLKPRFETLRLIFRIAFSLVYQDLPEYFEDHMSEWMEQIAKYLQPNVFPVLQDPDEETEPSPVDKVQTAMIALLSHYADKDEETFIENYLPNMMTLVWHLLLNVSAQTKHDNLATTSIRFLTGLVAKQMHNNLFKDEATLKQIVLNIVIPNLYFREVDEERFEDDPREFMVTEVEGSDSETRRKCSLDCLKAMGRQFEATTNICIGHIQSMIAEDVGGKNWKAKDAAINLMMGIAIRAESNQGVSQINPGANVLDFLQTQVMPELQDGNHSNRAVVKATSIKFVATFRNQFSKQEISSVLPVLIAHLSSPIVVVHTFAAYAIERMLMAQDDSKQRKIGSAELIPIMEPLFNGLFTIVSNVEQNENDYAMKCIMRALSTAGSSVVQVTGVVIGKLTEVLGRAAKNPRNPQFNHYLFESIAVLIRNVCSQDPNATTSFENLLFEPFNVVLQLQVDEFTPYVFQVLAQLLEYRPRESGLGDAYEQLFPPLMTAGLWEKGKVPALARLLQAYLNKAGPSLVTYIEPILGIFQKLLTSRQTEEHSFMVLSAAVLYFPAQSLEQYLPTIFKLLFTRLQAHRSSKFKDFLTHFFALFAGKFGAESFVAIINGVQTGMATMVIKDVWASHIVSNPPSQRTLAKTQLVGLTRLLCDSAILLGNPAGEAGWAAGSAAAVRLMSLSTIKDNNKVANLGEVVDTIEISYDAQFSQLQFARRPLEDPFADVADPGALFCQSLNQFSQQHPGCIGPLIQNGLTGDEKLTSSFQQLITNKLVILA